MQRALASAAVGRTTVSVAHRLATVRGAACIAVMRGGRVVEQGSHEELAGREGGAYAGLLRAQAPEGRGDKNDRGEMKGETGSEENFVMYGAMSGIGGGEANKEGDEDQEAWRAEAGTQQGEAHGSSRGVRPRQRAAGSSESVTPAERPALPQSATIEDGDTGAAAADKELEVDMDGTKAAAAAAASPGSLRDLLALHRPEWLHGLAASLGALVAGLAIPVWGFVAAYMTAALFDDDSAYVLQLAKVFSIGG